MVLDTSVFIHDQKIEELDLAALLDLRDERITLLVPMAVVDELDGLKESKDKHARWRAGYSLSVLDRTLSGSELHGRLRPPDMTPLESGKSSRGEVVAEVVLDPPGHRRLPIADDEIIDRAVAIGRTADRPMRLVTFDTGMAMRGRAAGLVVRKRSSADADSTEPPSGRTGP